MKSYPLSNMLAQLVKLPQYHLWLASTAVWLIVPVYRSKPLDWFELIVAWPLFIFFYIEAHSHRAAASFAYVGAIFVLGSIYVPVNPGASGVFCFCGAVIAARVPRPMATYAMVFAATALLFAESKIFHLNNWTWIGGGSGVFLFCTYVFLDTKQREANSYLWLAREEVARLAKLEERERIAQDLHDVLGHTLSLIAIKSELAGKTLAFDHVKAKIEVEQIEKIAREALDRVRSALHGDRITHFGGEVEQIKLRIQSMGIEVELRVEPIELSAVQESVLSMVLQEATTNVVRHSQANHCLIEVFRANGNLNLIVRDNGRGAKNFEGFGTRGLRKRLEVLGGKLRLVSQNGTELHAFIPLAE